MFSKKKTEAEVSKYLEEHPEEFKSYFGEYEEQAKGYIDDKDRLEELLDKMEEKLKKIPKLGDKLADLPLMILMVRAYARGEYKEVPMGTLIAAIIGIIYVVMPVDLIPDTIPGIGHLDDAVFIGLLLPMIHDDLKEFEKWKNNH